MRDYGGPVGFRILSRHPEWLEWLIIQNTNAYEVGLWKNRTPETEKPVMGFLELDAIKGVYLHGHKKRSWPDWCGKAKWRILPAVGSWLTQSRPPGKAATGGRRHGRAYQERGAAA